MMRTPCSVAEDYCHGRFSKDDEVLRHDKNKLVLATVLCSIFMVAEVIGGYISGSLAIMTDAAHMLSDIASFMISLFAIYMSQKPATQLMTFGFARAEIVGAILSIVLIWMLTGVLVFEAIQRIRQPQDINGKIMFIMALFGLVLNIILGMALNSRHTHEDHEDHEDHDDDESMRLFNEQDSSTSTMSEVERRSNDPEKNINIKAAFIHVLGDLVQSLGVVIAGIIIWYKPEYRLADPICTFIFSILVLLTTFGLFRDALHVLMEGSPRNIDPSNVLKDLYALTQIEKVHDLHIWSLTADKVALSVHLELKENANVHLDDVLHMAQRLLCRKYHIHHTTIQVESFGLPSACPHL